MRTASSAACGHQENRIVCDGRYPPSDRGVLRVAMPGELFFVSCVCCCGTIRQVFAMNVSSSTGADRLFFQHCEESDSAPAVGDGRIFVRVPVRLSLRRIQNTAGPALFSAKDRQGKRLDRQARGGDGRAGETQAADARGRFRCEGRRFGTAGRQRGNLPCAPACPARQKAGKQFELQGDGT